MVAQKKTATKAEKARRKAQSNRDKKGSAKSVVVRQPRPKLAKAKKGSGGGASPYARLVLDPCHGPMEQTNLPGSSGGQQVRCPFRIIATMPSATQTITGAAQTGGAVSNTLFGVLTPHALVPGAGPAAITISSQGSESAAFGTVSAGPGANYFITQDPLGLSQVASLAGEVRPIAACIKVSCLSADTVNSGNFFGYEGAARQYIDHQNGDMTQNYYPAASAQQIMLSGGQATTNTFSTFESKINYPNADSSWQEFRQTVGFTAVSSVKGSYRSGDASESDFSEMPIAIIGVANGTPGAQYLFDGAIVYEWQPKLTIGVDTPDKQPSNPNALASTARTVQAVAKGLGGMLVNVVSDYATGGSATAVNHMLKLAFNASQSRHNSGAPMIGWR